MTGKLLARNLEISDRMPVFWQIYVELAQKTKTMKKEKSC